MNAREYFFGFAKANHLKDVRMQKRFTPFIEVDGFCKTDFFKNLFKEFRSISQEVCWDRQAMKHTKGISSYIDWWIEDYARRENIRLNLSLFVSEVSPGVLISQERQIPILICWRLLYPKIFRRKFLRAVTIDRSLFGFDDDPIQDKFTMQSGVTRYTISGDSLNTLGNICCYEIGAIGNGLL